MASSVLLLHVLLIALLANAIESRQMFEKQPIIYNTDKQNIIYTKQPIIYTDKQNIIYTDKQNIIYTKNNPKPSSNIHDPSEMIFFTEKDLKQGNKIPIYFPKNAPGQFRRLLTKNEADSIPFSSKHLKDILARFSAPEGSAQAEAMAYTITTCEAEPIEGETRTCATSMDSMLDFVGAAFGSDAKPVATSTKIITDSFTGKVQNYTVLGATEIAAPKMVACHTMPYPYAVYFCHFQTGGRKMYRVALAGPGGRGGADMDAVAVCHMITYKWPKDHAAFRVLGFKPGTQPVCHFFPADNFAWVPAPVSQG